MAVPEYQRYLEKILSGQILAEDEFMNLEYLRLSTYITYPMTAKASATRLAKSGLFYQGRDDEVRCFSCKGTMSDWTWDVSPDEKHRSRHPHCLFMLGRDRSNIPYEPFFPDSNSSEEALTHTLARLSIGRRDAQNNTLSIGVIGPQAVASDTAHVAPPGNNNNNQSLMPSSQQGATNDVALQREPTDPRHRSITTPSENTPIDIAPTPTIDSGNPLGSLANGHIRQHTHAARNSNRRNNRRNTGSREGNFREDVRLRSFLDRWPADNPMTPEELASAGFYYTGISDRVQCAFCFGVLRNWEEGDEAMSEHARYFPNCPFILHEEVNNVPMEQITPTNPDVLAQTLGITVNEGTDDLGVVMQRPKRPDMAIESVRLKTFERWPTQMAQSAQDLASAGFYYTGFADNVKCFFCDGGLRNWEQEDDVWASHARWFPKCGFVKNVKGETYIEKILKDQGQTSNSGSRGSSGNARNVGEHEIKARMDTATVRAVLDMGYDRDLVMKVIAKRLHTTGDDFQKAENLLESIFEIEEQIKNGTFVDPMATTGGAANTEASDAGSRDAQTGEDTDKGKPAEDGKSQKSKKKKQKKKKSEKAAAENKPEENSAAEKNAPEMDEKTAEDLREELVSLRAENEKQKDMRMCKICFDNDACIVFLPCGHLVTCSHCASAVRHCPICRKTIKGTVRTILS